MSRNCNCKTRPCPIDHLQIALNESRTYLTENYEKGMSYPKICNLLDQLKFQGLVVSSSKGKKWHITQEGLDLLRNTK